MECNIANDSEKFIRAVNKIVYAILGNENLTSGEWHNGKVAQVVSTTALKVFVDGSGQSQTIPCNPSVTFSVGDEVFVHFVNGDSKNKFIPYKRAVTG